MRPTGVSTCKGVKPEDVAFVSSNTVTSGYAHVSERRGFGPPAFLSYACLEEYGY